MTAVSLAAGVDKARQLGYPGRLVSHCLHLHGAGREDDAVLIWRAEYPHDPTSWTVIVRHAEEVARHDAATGRWESGMERVLEDVRAERRRQVAKYGLNDDLEDGTGPNMAWLAPITYRPAAEVEAAFRQEYLDHEDATSKPTWMHLVREELAEAFKEAEPERLAAELVQVVALGVSWLEKLASRPTLVLFDRVAQRHLVRDDGSSNGWGWAADLGDATVFHSLVAAEVAAAEAGGDVEVHQINS